MNNIKNKLIPFLAISAFVFGLLFASPAHAMVTSVMNSGDVTFSPVYNYNDNNNSSNYNNNYNGNQTNYGSNSNYNNSNSSQNNTKTNSNTNTQTSANSNTVNPNSSNNNSSSSTDSNDSYSSLTSNALFGSNSFLPSGLGQWIILAIIILAIIFLWRYIHRSEEKYVMEPMKHA